MLRYLGGEKWDGLNAYAKSSKLVSYFWLDTREMYGYNYALGNTLIAMAFKLSKWPNEPVTRFT